MIKVADVIGRLCITEEDGQRLYDLIHPLLKQNRRVELEVGGVTLFASPFFNAAIGSLLADIPSEVLRERLVFHNLEPTDHALLKRVIENAKRIFSDPDYRENIKRLIFDEAGEESHGVHV
jgi:hypothetical protein